jgi:3'-phosphoadenosine 5'-phosphosulfate sulfotransferase (PAPS reductase)/FAD synthetase
MGSKVDDTIKMLQELAGEHKSVAVAYSGGKDSNVVLDLALRFFEHVYPYYMYYIPGLDFDKRRMEFCKERFGCEVLLYPHYVTIQALKSNTYIDPFPELDDLPDLDVVDIDNMVMNDTGSTVILDGFKKADGFFRRRIMAATKRTRKHQIHPIGGWLRWEVLNYCKARNLPIPDQSQGDNAGISLSVKEVLHMYDNYSHDYELMRSFFPYIETIVERRKLFGRIDG